MYSVCSVFLQASAETSDIPSSFIIVIGFLLIGLGFTFLVFLVISRQRQNQLVVERKILQREFQQQLLQSQIEVQEATFSTLGKELHDNIGQLLSTTKMLIGI